MKIYYKQKINEYYIKDSLEIETELIEVEIPDSKIYEIIAKHYNVSDETIYELFEEEIVKLADEEMEK